MEITCTSLQTDNHASTSPLSFFTGRMSFLPPNQQRQSTEGVCSLSATKFEQVRAISTCQDSSNLVADRFEGKFHYAILVADRSETGRRPVAYLLARASSLGQIPARCRSATSFCDKDSVMEFGINDVFCMSINDSACMIVSN